MSILKSANRTSTQNQGTVSGQEALYQQDQTGILNEPQSEKKRIVGGHLAQEMDGMSTDVSKIGDELSPGKDTRSEARGSMQ